MFIKLGRPKAIADLKTLQNVYQTNVRPKVPIVVIDDEGFDYRDILRQHDFSIKVLDDIADIKAIETYAIVVCDIRGVGKHYESRFEGAHLISEIRKYYPQKVLIAYTGQQFDASYNEYFGMCDFSVKKDIDSDEWVERLDNAVELASDPMAQWKRLRDYLLGRDVPLYTLMLLEDQYVSSLLNKRSDFPRGKVYDALPDDIRDILKSITASVVFKLIVG